MHYCCYLITKDCPSDETISNILQPFNDDYFYENFYDEETDTYKKERPVVMWDFWRVGGRYNSRLKLKIDTSDEKYKWEFILKEARVRRLYRSFVMEELDYLKNKERRLYFEEDYYPALGYLDGYLRVDGAAIKDIINMDDEVNNCYCIIEETGEAISRETWDGNEYKDNPYFDDQARKIIESCKDEFITVIDMHD